MAYRFTDTDKWNDVWFSELKPIEKLLFNYICDNCDIAGFIEIIPKRWAFEIGTDKSQIEGALKGLERGLIISDSGDCLYIRNFLKHQKNLPLNPRNKAHKGIIKRFELYSYKFNIQDINLFIEGATKGLISPTGIGNGIGNDIKGGMGEKSKTHSKQKPVSMLMRESPVNDINYLIENIGEAYSKYDLTYYHQSLLNWSDSKAEKKVDWVATIRNAILRDEKDGKAKLKQKQNNTQNQPITNANAYKAYK